MAGRYRQIAKQMEDAARKSEDGSLDIAAFCERIGVSSRTVRRAFLATHGMGPNQYLQLLRLQRVRRVLLSEGTSRQTITQIAGNFGPCPLRLRCWALSGPHQASRLLSTRSS